MTTPSPAEVAVVDAALESRRSVRAFLPTPVPKSVICDILRVASRAPSGANTQPWRVWVLTGEVKESLSAKLLAAHNDPQVARLHTEEYAYYPKQWISPFIDRRRKIGLDLYRLLGLGREDKTGMHAQHGRNYAFFDAPVGLMFSINRVLEQGSWLDYGMFIQNVMIAARARGLDTIAQGAFNPYHRIIREHLQWPESDMLVCGMSLGHADETRIENTLATERARVEEFTTFLSAS